MFTLSDAERCVAISQDGLWWPQLSRRFIVRYGGTAGMSDQVDI